MNNSAQPSTDIQGRLKSSFSGGSGQQSYNSQPQKGNGFSDAQKLAVFSQVLDAIEEKNQQLNPPRPLAAGSKEAVEKSASPDLGQAESGAIQYVEQEKNPEIPVEVEGFLQKVEDLADEKPPEIFIADGTQENPSASYPSRPVIVLPITEEIEEAGLKKNSAFSIRWLVEWSHKIIKMFAGKVIYKGEEV